MRSNMLNALFPRTRQNILAALLPSPERRWYLSDLAQHLHVPPSSLQREMASLTEAGVLCRETDGNRVYYSANAAHPLLPEMQGIFCQGNWAGGHALTLRQRYCRDAEILQRY